MINFEKLSKIYFSPSGTTKKVVDEVAKNFNLKSENYDLLSFDEKKCFKDELVIIGMPVFNARIPELAYKRLSQMKADNTKAVVILNYGNMDYGDSLLELCELLKENNFKIVGVATTVSQNSLFNQIAENRPDKSDLEKISEFSKRVMEKLESKKENEIFVSGYKPYPEYEIPEFSISCDESLCTECLDCVYTCPEEAIVEKTPTMTRINDCTRCTTCINVCQEGARSFSGPNYEVARNMAISDYQTRQEPEFFI